MCHHLNNENYFHIDIINTLSPHIVSIFILIPEINILFLKKKQQQIQEFDFYIYR